MSQIVQKLRINRRLESKPCLWCNEALNFGENAAVCKSCEAVHHATCWDENLGCGNVDCLNAPFSVDETPISDPELGTFTCPHCKAIIDSDATICPSCKKPTDPSGIFQGERQTSPKARKAFIQALVGLLIPILAFFALSNASEAKVELEADPTLTGRWMATTAQVLGVIELLLWVVNAIATFGNIR